jgi:hypothetical protein
MNLRDEAVAKLETMFRFQIAQGEGGWLEDALPVPTWQMLCWLADTKDVLLHGTGDPEITVFEPRQSNDVAEFGNRKAVYAASDGLWAMFFAIVDRVRYRMTIVNAAIRLETPDSPMGQPHYFFSLTDTVLKEAPWREGVVYILPRRGFEEERGYQFEETQVHTNHWASLEPVCPRAKVRVSPQDFPFLSQIRGQDDDVLAARAEANPNGFPWVE